MYKPNITMYAEEHISSILFSLREISSQYKKPNEDIITTRDKLKSDLDSQTWLKFKTLIRLMIKKNHVENVYLYCQGMKDIVSISNYVECEILESNFMFKEADDDF